MPKYIFTCEQCNNKKHKYVSIETDTVPCKKCNGTMIREMPKLSEQTKVTELIDSYSGINLDQNHAEQIKKRHDDYYWETEVPRLIQKYSLETCLEQGWLVYNDKKELEIGKPPSKR